MGRRARPVQRHDPLTSRPPTPRQAAGPSDVDREYSDFGAPLIVPPVRNDRAGPGSRPRLLARHGIDSGRSGTPVRRSLHPTRPGEVDSHDLATDVPSGVARPDLHRHPREHEAAPPRERRGSTLVSPSGATEPTAEPQHAPDSARSKTGVPRTPKSPPKPHTRTSPQNHEPRTTNHEPTVPSTNAPDPTGRFKFRAKFEGESPDPNFARNSTPRPAPGP